MKTNTLSPFSLLSAILLILVFWGCSKPEDGAVGPAGPAGTANVIYSDWITAPATTPGNIDGTNGNITNIAAPKLTQDILDKGTVLVYAKFSTTYFPLPYTSNAGGAVNTINFYPEVNNIKLFRFKHDGTGGIGISSTVTFRYILIPGGTVAGTAKQVQPDFQKMSYAEVCAYLKIRA